MDLTEFFQQFGRAALNALALSVDRDPDYLWTCAAICKSTGKPRRLVGAKLCIKLVIAEPRLTLAKLRPDLYGTATV